MVTKSGYFYAYASNADSLTTVYFDDFQVSHVRGPTSVNGQIGGSFNNTIYQSIDERTIEKMMTRINMPYHTDYAIDADYIEAKKTEQSIDFSHFGTSGAIYTIKQD